MSIEYDKYFDNISYLEDWINEAPVILPLRISHQTEPSNLFLPVNLKCWQVLGNVNDTLQSVVAIGRKTPNLN